MCRCDFEFNVKQKCPVKRIYYLFYRIRKYLEYQSLTFSKELNLLYKF